MKKAYIIHGWGGYPEEGWFPWIKKELEAKGFQVFIPKMPNPDNPKIGEWLEFLKKQIKKNEENTILIGHSIGCQTIMRYLENLKENIKFKAIFFVAGWFNLKPLETLEEEEIAKPWIKTPIDLEKVKSHSSNWLCIFSDNDYYVPLSDKDIFEKKLNAKIIIEHNKFHYNGGDNIKEIPILLKEILDL